MIDSPVVPYESPVAAADESLRNVAPVCEQMIATKIPKSLEELGKLKHGVSDNRVRELRTRSLQRTVPESAAKGDCGACC